MSETYCLYLQNLYWYNVPVYVLCVGVQVGWVLLVQVCGCRGTGRYYWYRGVGEGVQAGISAACCSCWSGLTGCSHVMTTSYS